MNGKPSVALVLIYNHRFEQSIDRLESIYGDRFSHIFHVIPFYRGNRANVIPVYESSHHFVGFFAQAHAALTSEGFDYYLACADDLLLNPRLNEENITGTLGLDSESAYIKQIAALTDAPFSWPHTALALVTFAHNNGVEWERELPPTSDALAAFARHDLETKDVNLRQFRKGIRPKQLAILMFYFLKRLQKKVTTPETRFAEMPYPAASGYADFFAVPRSAFDSFCHLCGVLAAMDLFAEIAIPTAMALSCRRIRQEAEISMRGDELWTPDEVDHFGRAHGFDLHQLEKTFPADRLYVHPVKLSKWVGEFSRGADLN